MKPEGSLPCTQEATTGFLSWAKWIQSYLRSILILTSNLRLLLPLCQFLSGFWTKILYNFFIPPMRATFPKHLILLHLASLVISGEDYVLSNFTLQFSPYIWSHLMRYVAKIWSGLNWLRIGSNGELQWTWWCAFRFHTTNVTATAQCG
jgi:hypothetical protein